MHCEIYTRIQFVSRSDIQFIDDCQKSTKGRYIFFSKFHLFRIFIQRASDIYIYIYISVFKRRACSPSRILRPQRKCVSIFLQLSDIPFFGISKRATRSIYSMALRDCRKISTTKI